MEEQEDEVGITMESSTTSSWFPAEGTLNQSVKVVEESEDAIYTAEPTSKLVLVAPSSSTPLSSPSADYEPCELTVTFKQRHGHIHQIYVLSTARICEIYGQKEQDGDRDYVCTVRGGIISLTDDDDSADDASNVSPGATVEEDLTSGSTSSNVTSLVPSATPALAPAEGGQGEVPPSENQSPESLTSGKVDSLQESAEFPSLTRRDSEDDLFRSFTEATNGRAAEGSVIFEESLDHADWVECPHSPMKSPSATSDDEGEVGVTNSGFYFIDADSESQQAGHPEVCLFTDAIRDSGKNPTSHSLERGDTGSSNHSSWQEAIEESTLQKGLTDGTMPYPSTSERISAEACKLEEPFESPRAHVDEFADDFIGENLPKSAFCDFEVNEERDCSLLGTTKLPAVKPTLESLGEEIGDVERRFPVEAPVYECEVGLVDADAWTSVTIRLLSIKTKSQVEIYRVVVTHTPGSPIQPPVVNNRGPFQQGVGTSSLLAMLVPGILQMARGLSEPRIANNISTSSAEKGTGSDRTPSKVTRGELSSLPPNLITAPDSAPDQAKSTEHQSPLVVEKNHSAAVTDVPSPRSNVAQSDSGGSASLRSFADGENQLLTGNDRGLPESVLLRPVHEVRTGKEFEGTFSVNKETGPLEAQQKEDRVDELVQRLDRLETICLRMESSLNSALDNMDKRLKVLELGGPGRMTPALGQPIWGPGVDSGSFLSATSGYVPAVFTGPGTPSLLDAQVPFSMCSAVDVPLVKSSVTNLSSKETPVNPSVVSSSPPPSLSPAVPSWPLSSWAQNVSPDSSSHSSGLTTSFTGKHGLMNLSSGSLHGSEHPSNGGETYWESRTSDESESDISSDSEQTSFADNCEDAACGCCPESLSSSPIKPAQRVDNALASALSAFSASFGTQKKSFCKQDEFYHGEEDSDGEDSFASEEQVPLVELDSFPCHQEKEKVVHGDAENVFMHGYEAIPLSSDKDIGDVSVSKGILEDNFWSSEVEENQQINWQVEEFQSPDEKIVGVLEGCFPETEEGTKPFESFSAFCAKNADQPTLADPTTIDVFFADLETTRQRSAILDNAGVGEVVESLLEALVQDPQSPFVRELIAGPNGCLFTPHLAWLQPSLTGEKAEIAKTLLSSDLTFRDLSKPLDSQEEMMSQEGYFLDDWNWFTSEFSPFSSLVEVRDVSEDPAEKEHSVLRTETVDMLDGISSRTAPNHVEPWSLLDDDVSIPSTTEQFGSDMYGQDWPGPLSQWSLPDEYPPDLISGDEHPEGGLQHDSREHREPLSLLDEDISIPSVNFPDVDQDAVLFSHTSIGDSLKLNGSILSSAPLGKVHDVDADANLLSSQTSIKDHLNLNDVILSSVPSGKVPDVDQDANLFSSQKAPEDHLNINDFILSSNYLDMSHSPSSEASRSNPFEDECKETLVDLTQRSSKAPLVSMEGFLEKVWGSEASEPEGTQSLLGSSKAPLVSLEEEVWESEASEPEGTQSLQGSSKAPLVLLEEEVWESEASEPEGTPSLQGSKKAPLVSLEEEVWESEASEPEGTPSLQGSKKAPLVSLEEEVYESEASEPEGTQSLLFHLSL